MRMPHLNLSPSTLSRNFGIYLLNRLLAVPELAEVLEYFRSVRAPLLEVEETYQETVMNRRVAMAKRDAANHKMDKETRILSFTLLGVVNNNRSSPLYRHFFPDGFSGVLETPVLQQRRRSVVLLEKLEAERNEAVRARLEPFRAQLQALDDALAAVEAARDAEARARGNRETAKLEWLDGYRRTYRMLQDHYSHDPREAESFFRRVRSRPGTADEDNTDFETDLDDLEDDALDEEFSEEIGEDDEAETESGPIGARLTPITGADLIEMGPISPELGLPGSAGAEVVSDEDTENEGGK